MTALTYERLLNLIDYDPETGVITAMMDRGPVRVGDILGTKNARGYVTLTLDGKRYYAHRVVWFFVHGEWPAIQLDHRNRIKSDNRLVNLRLATNSQNQANIPTYGKWGHKGVSEVNGRFCSQITFKGIKHYLGCYGTPSEAREAYSDRAEKLQGEFMVKDQ